MATNFRPMFYLNCYSHVASIFTFISDDSVKLLLLKCLRSIEMKKLRVTIAVPELQSLILHVTGRVALLVHSIVPNVPISPQNPKMISITILLSSTVPQNLMSLSTVNIVIKSFQDLLLKSTEKHSTRNANRIRNKRCGCGTHSGRC